MRRPLLLFSFAILAVTQPAHGADILSATPAGSWQVREQTTTDHKGKQKVAVIKTSLLSEESRAGKAYVWIEVETSSFKLDGNGTRKKDGAAAIVKMLVKRAAFAMDPDNVQNVMNLAEEAVVQTGDKDPVRMDMNAGGGLVGSLLKATNTKIDFSYKDLGTESITVPSGTFKCKKVSGSGSAEVKVLFKKIKSESTVVSWISTKVPFGIVQQSGTNKSGGKEETFTVTLLEFGVSGAVSKITKTPKG